MRDGVKLSVDAAKLQIIELFNNTSTTLDDVEAGATLLATAIEESVMGIISK